MKYFFSVFFWILNLLQIHFWWIFLRDRGKNISLVKSPAKIYSKLEEKNFYYQFKRKKFFCLAGICFTSCEKIYTRVLIFFTEFMINWKEFIDRSKKSKKLSKKYFRLCRLFFLVRLKELGEDLQLHGFLFNFHDKRIRFCLK